MSGPTSLLLASIPPLVACVLLTLSWDWTGVVQYGSNAITRNDSMPADARQPVETNAYVRSTVYFGSHGDQLEAWAYLPKKDEVSAGASQPCVLMAHGLGGQKDFGLHRFANSMANEGFVTVAFDYRCFGGSSGEPRNWVSPTRHVEDWVAAIHAMQPGGELLQLLGVTCSSLSLWGTSFSGGHVLVAAATSGANISAIVSQIPHLSAREVSLKGLRERGVLGTLRLAALGLHDLVRTKLGMPAAYIRLGALMILSEDEKARYYSKHPAVKRGNWTPWVPARLVLDIARYSPVNHLSRVSSPVLFIAATQDMLCPVHIIREAANSCDNCELYEVNATHFSMYEGQPLHDITEEILSFLKIHAT